MVRYLIPALCSVAAFAGAGSTTFAQPHAHDHHDVHYQFGARSHTERLAAQLHNRANAMCWEMWRNYQQAPGWRETYAEAYSLSQDTKHIRELVHDEYHHGHHEEDHIARDLHEIDQLFHHVEEDVQHWVPYSVAYRHPHHHQHGLQYKMEELEETLHHLMRDYGVESRLSPEGNQDDTPPPVAPH